MNDNVSGTSGEAGKQPVREVACSTLPTKHGEFRIHVYQALNETVEHVAMVMGEPRGQENVLVRVHSECLTGDVLGSQRCDCGEQLEYAMEQIGKAGLGVIVYVRGHEGRGIGLANKIRAYQLQDAGLDTVEANLQLGLPVDDRDYDAASAILHDLGVASIRLMTNNPVKLKTLRGYGLNIVDRVAVLVQRTPYNSKYLDAKQQKLGHMLEGGQ